MTLTTFREFLAALQGQHHRTFRRRRSTIRVEPLECRLLLSTFIVDGDPGDSDDEENLYATIQEAVDSAAANPGDDTVLIRPGTYHETVDIADNSGALTLRGEHGHERSQVVIDGGGSNVIEAAMLNDIVIAGLSVTGGGVGITAENGPAGVTLRNVDSSNNTGGGLVATDAGDVTTRESRFTGNNFGIFILRAGDVTMRNVVSTDNRRDGLQVNQSGDVTVSGGHYDDNRVHGMLLFDNADIVASRATFSGNGDNGIDLLGTDSEMLFYQVDVTENGLDSDVVISGVFVRSAQTFTMASSEVSGNDFDGLGVLNVSEGIAMLDVEASGNGRSGLVSTNPGSRVTVVGGEYSDNARHGLDLNNLVGLTVFGAEFTSNGSADSGAAVGGAGIRVRTTSLESILIASSRIDGNVSTRGGGGLEIVATQAADVVIANTEVTNNQTRRFGSGGGMRLIGLGRFVIRDSVIAGNTGGFGGGLRVRDFNPNADGSLRIERSTIADNTAHFRGGGIEAATGELIVDQSTVSGNSSGDSGGGGLRVVSTPTTIVNSTISGNETDSSGGGIQILNEQDPFSLVNATIAENAAGENGGGVAAFSGEIRVINTLVATNTAQFGPDFYNPSAPVNSLGHNLIGDGTGSNGFNAQIDQIGTASNPIDPRLGPLADNGGPTQTHALLADSPALDAGAATSHPLVPDVDQRGVARPQGNGVDIGAFERASSSQESENTYPAPPELALLDSVLADWDELATDLYSSGE